MPIGDGHLLRGALQGAINGASVGKPAIGAAAGLIVAAVQCAQPGATPAQVQQVAAQVAATPIVQAHVEAITAAADAMPGGKPWTKSKGVLFSLGGILVALGTIAGALMDGFQPATDFAIIGPALAGLFTASGSLWGRLTAKEPIAK